MTTIIAKLDPQLAKRVAQAADIIGLTHEQLALQAIRLLVRSVAPSGPVRKTRGKARRQ